jgi:Ca2+/Na+ antiporter
VEGSGNLILMCVFFGLEGKVETPTLPRQLGIPVHVLLGCLRIMVKAVIVLFLLSFLSILQVFSMLRPTFYCFCMFFFFKARWALVEERACM